MRNLQRSRSANGVSSLPIGTHPLADSRPFAVVSIEVQDNLMKRAARVRLLHGACVDEQKRVAVVTHRISLLPRWAERVTRKKYKKY